MGARSWHRWQRTFASFSQDLLFPLPFPHLPGVHPNIVPSEAASGFPLGSHITVILVSVTLLSASSWGWHPHTPCSACSTCGPAQGLFPCLECRPLESGGFCLVHQDVPRAQNSASHAVTRAQQTYLKGKPLPRRPQKHTPTGHLKARGHGRCESERSGVPEVLQKGSGRTSLYLFSFFLF